MQTLTSETCMPNPFGDLYLTNWTRYNHPLSTQLLSSLVPWKGQDILIFSEVQPHLHLGPAASLIISLCFWSITAPRCGGGKAALHSHWFEDYTGQSGGLCFTEASSYSNGIGLNELLDDPQSQILTRVLRTFPYFPKKKVWFLSHHHHQYPKCTAVEEYESEYQSHSIFFSSFLLSSYNLSSSPWVDQRLSLQMD